MCRTISYDIIVNLVLAALLVFLWNSFTAYFKNSHISWEQTCNYRFVMYRVTNINSSHVIPQVADGLATPVVGIAIDKIGIQSYGKRKTWHAIGTACVAVAFSFIFHKCFGCEDSSEVVQQVSYG